MKENKKGQELSIGTLVLIVIGVIVLVLLVLGFSMGWSNLFSKIGIYQGSDETSAITACRSYISSNSLAGYCEFKSVKLGDKKLQVNCEYFEGIGAGKIEGNPLDCAEGIINLYCNNNNNKISGLKNVAGNCPPPPSS